MYAIQSNIQVVNGCKIDRYKDREEAVNAFFGEIQGVIRQV